MLSCLNNFVMNKHLFTKGWSSCPASFWCELDRFLSFSPRIFIILLLVIGSVGSAHAQLDPCPNNNDDVPTSIDPSATYSFDASGGVIPDQCLDSDGGCVVVSFTGIEPPPPGGCPVEFTAFIGQGCGGASGNICLFDMVNGMELGAAGGIISFCATDNVVDGTLSFVACRPGNGPLAFNDVSIVPGPDFDFRDETICSKLPATVNLDTFSIITNSTTDLSGGTWSLGGVDIGDPTSVSVPASALDADGCATFVYTAEVTTACSAPGTCSVSADLKICFEEPPAPTITPDCPASIACEAVADFSISAPYSNDEMDACLLDGSVMGVAGTAPGVCGGMLTVTFTLPANTGDNCTDADITATCTIEVQPGTVTPACPATPISIACGGMLPPISATAADACTPGYSLTNTTFNTTVACGIATTVTFSGTDDCGTALSLDCPVTITAGSVTPSCPATPISISCGGTLPPIAAAADACTPGYSLTSDFDTELACGFSGMVTFSGADDCGEMLSLACPVTITRGPEPILSCSSLPTSVVCTELEEVSFPTLTGAADGCTPGFTASPATITPSLGCDGSGTLSIVYAGTDDCGDVVGITCVVDVVIDQLPTINCPENRAFTVECADDIVLPTITWSSSCGMGGTLAAPAPVIVGIPDCDGSTYTFTYTLTDGCGVDAADNCVLVYTISNDGPTIDCSALPSTFVGCGTPLPGGMPTFTTSCELGGELSVSGPVVVGVPGCVGTTYTYTHTVTDDCGRTDVCEQVITVIANDAPVFDDAPANITVQCADDVPAPTALGVTDDCDVAEPVLPTDAITPGDCPNNFTVTRTWSFTDACGNEVTATRIIVVDDTTPPALPSPPANFSGVCASSIPPAVPLTAIDNCDGPITVMPTEQVSVDPNCANAVSILRTWTFTDACGNTASVSQSLNTADNTPPAIDCSQFPSVTLPCDATELPAPIIIAALDNCDGPIDAIIDMNGDISDFSACPDDGSLNIARTYTYTDGCGNASVCTQTFLLEPEEVEFIPCNDNNPCTFNDHVGLNCRGEVCVPCAGTERCRPFWCDDGNPCTFNDRVMIGCDGEICEPCMGTMEVADKDGDGYRDCEDLCPHDPNKGEPGACGCGNPDTDSDGDGTADCLDDCPDNPFTDESGTCSSCDAPGIESVEIVNIRACSDNGTGDNPDDDFFYGDIEVVFNFPPKLGGIDVSGPVELYYNFDNDNTSNVILIRDQKMAADGKPISITVAYRGNEECNACIHVGEAPPSCSVPPCIHPDYGLANDEDEACVADITLAGITKCEDNNTGSYDGDDFVRANITVHLNNAPSEGVLVVSGMTNHHVDMSEVDGDEYTFYDKVSFNQAHGWIVAEVMSHEDYSNYVHPDDMKAGDRIEYYYYGPTLGDCGFYKSVFECDPCTAANGYGNRQFTTFNAFKAERHVDLEWATNTSYKSSKYILEKSLDGVQFVEINTLANDKLSEEVEYFKGMDPTPEFGDNFYRLKQVFDDGTFEYSEIKLVEFGIDLDAISFFPNPAENTLFIDLDEYEGKSAHMIITDQYGQLMEEINFEKIPNELIKVDFSRYINGLYFIRTKVENSEYIAKKVIVSKMY